MSEDKHWLNEYLIVLQKIPTPTLVFYLKKKTFQLRLNHRDVFSGYLWHQSFNNENQKAAILSKCLLKNMLTLKFTGKHI